MQSSVRQVFTTMNLLFNLVIAVFLVLYGTGYTPGNPLQDEDEGASYTVYVDDHSWASQKQDDHKFIHTEEYTRELESYLPIVAVEHKQSIFYSPVTDHIRGPPASSVPA